MTRLRGRALAVALPVVVGGCMPWVAGETATTLAPGQVAAGAGVALLAPPDQPHRPMPVPQLWAALGVVDGVDLALAYAAPLTFQARARVRIQDGGDAGPAIAASVGGGVHGFPDLAEIGHTVWTPYALVAVHASRRGPRATPYGGVRAFVPFVLGAEPAATLWLAPHAGLELGRGRVRWGPELGAVVPTVRPGETQLLLGVSLRRISLP